MSFSPTRIDIIYVCYYKREKKVIGINRLQRLKANKPSPLRLSDLARPYIMEERSLPNSAFPVEPQLPRSANPLGRGHCLGSIISIISC